MTYLYCEGHRDLRPGFRKLLARFPHVKPIPCGNTQETEKTWKRQRSATTGTHLLLVDSDKRVLPPPSDSEFFMVQEMESWFFVDLEILRKYYGDGFNPNSIPKRPVEEIPDAKECLKDATKNTKKGRYHEVQHGGDLLKLIDLETVRKAPNLDRLVCRLEDLKS